MPFIIWFILIVDIGIRRSKDRLELWLMNRVKINGIPMFNLPLILTVTIVDRNLTEFLVYDKSSSNILYADTMDMLGIQQTNMNSYSRRDLLAFNDSITCCQWTMDLIVTFGEGTSKIKIILNFLAISCRSAFRGILWRSFIVRLDALTSPVHLKLAYHNA